ncbi:MAG: class I SAM-dependent DNA methyltransferase [Betaproteobacteria bacterium]
MTPQEFVAKWRPGTPSHGLSERAGAQPHFIDLCRALGVPEPGEPERYCFERGVTKTGSAAARTDGFADVWLKGHFAWEYKRPCRSLGEALKQLMMYALPLESPPLLVVCDRVSLEVHTHFTGTPSERHVFDLAQLPDPAVQQRLRTLWTAPESWRPRLSNREITEQAARTFAATAERLRGAGVPAEVVSHFLTQCVFCFFAEDVGLLPERLFERLMHARVSAAQTAAQLATLLATMRDGGLFGVAAVPWFNGGLFADVNGPPLAEADIAALRTASTLDWSAIDPSIFGTLFERGLDPAKRAQLGAHYTDPATIARLVEPVVTRPLLAEWAAVRDHPREGVAAALGKSKRHGDKAWQQAQAAFAGFLERLRWYKVLDPACGSGNFLYLALKALKDVEHQVNLEAEALGLERQIDGTGPHNVLGIELNEYAAELARVTVWIGELQWRVQRGYPFKMDPVLEPLDHIECRDAVLAGDGQPAHWPSADAVVGNPPFVGDKKMRAELGDAYTEALRAANKGRVPGGADLVCYWFEQARRLMAEGRLQRAGLVSTNSIRGGRNREVLDAIVKQTRIFEAWSDEPWVNDGAAVRVSLVAFGDGTPVSLDGRVVNQIGADLTATTGEVGVDLTAVGRLAECAGACFQGSVKVGDFDVEGQTAREWLQLPNVHGESNAAVLRPLRNAKDLTTRSRDAWLVDFAKRSQSEAAMFELPFSHVVMHVKPFRDANRDRSRRENWWLHGRTGDDLRAATKPLSRVIVTPRVAKFRTFVWMHPRVYVDDATALFARADDTTFGLLHSRLHELWSLRMCTWMGKGNDPRYTPTTCFETFPFPAGLTPADTAHQRTEPVESGALIPAELPPAVRAHAGAIAQAAQRLVALRDAWLNPPEWTERLPEVVPLGLATSPYPDRIVARPGFEAQLAKRTLTNLYNQRPTWLAQAHEALDAAVAAAYGWADWAPAMPDDEILRRLLALNRERAGAG